MISRRTLFANAFVAVGFFATRRLAPKVEEETVRVRWQLPVIETYCDGELVASHATLTEAMVDMGRHMNSGAAMNNIVVQLSQEPGHVLT